ncbi:MAG TPA: ethylbenzene dehydrogenase-related protein [Anaerolineae bacterium]|nr:ethylbenzene dehydrogenase-related protein [Anaerolineae bacterium]
MMKPPRFLLAALILAAIILTFFKIPLASSQSLTLMATQVEGDLPLNDPDAALWQKSTALDVPLSAQTVTLPQLKNTNVKSIKARALRNDQQLAILVEWSDSTQDDTMVRIQDFRDAVAVQFPLITTVEPYICMGMAGTDVNIWHWKADWQADIAARQDMETVYPNMNVDFYPFAAANLPAPADYTDPNYVTAYQAGNAFAQVHTTPVENLIAGGFGTLTSLPTDNQPVQGYGVYANGQWRVIFVRDLQTTLPDNAQFEPGKTYPLAFAAWDGANGERNGQKSVSQWISLSITKPAAAQPASKAGGVLTSIDVSQMTILAIVGALLLFAVGASIAWKIETRGSK